MQFYRLSKDLPPKVVLLNKNTLTPPQMHLSRVAKEYILYYILEGSMLLNDNGQTVELSEGDVYLFYEGEYHEPIESRYCKYYYIHFNGDVEHLELDESGVIDELWSCRSYYLCAGTYDSDKYGGGIILPKLLHIGVGTQSKKIVQLMRDGTLGTSSSRREFYKTVSALRTLEIFIELYRIYSEKRMNEVSAFGPVAVGELVGFLQNNITEHITGELLEEKLGYCFDYMNRRFKSATGKTIFNYLTEMRIGRAMLLMRTKKMSLSQIAAECGFCDVYYFSRVFKRVKGLSPSQYLNNLDS